MREKWKAGFCIFYGIKWNHRVGPFAALSLVSLAFVLSVLFLYLGRIQEYDAGYLGSGSGTVNPAGEALLNQLRQETAVVEMGVSQKDGIYAGRFNGEGVPVSCPEMSFLVKSTVYKESGTVGFKKVPGAGDILSCAKKFEFYLHSLPCFESKYDFWLRILPAITGFDKGILSPRMEQAGACFFEVNSTDSDPLCG